MNYNSASAKKMPGITGGGLSAPFVNGMLSYQSKPGWINGVLFSVADGITGYKFHSNLRL